MQKHDDSNIPTFIADNSNTSQPQVRQRQITIGTIIAASVGPLIFAGWLIQPEITHKPALKLLGYSCAVLFATGYLCLAIAPQIDKLTSTEQKQLNYIAFVIGAILLFLSSLGLLFIIHKPELGWWAYFSPVAMLTSISTMTFSEILGRERKRLSDLLNLIGLLSLVLGIFVPTFLELHN